MSSKISLRIRRFTYTSFLLALLSSSACVYSQTWETWKELKPEVKTKNRKEVKHSDPLFDVLIRNYQLNVSPKQGPKCPASPSCSSFTLKAMTEYGFMGGLIMGLDRIYFRENFDMKYLKHYLPVILENNTIKVYDPVEANNIFAKKNWTIIDPDYSAQPESK